MKDLIKRAYRCPICQEAFESLQVKHSAKRVVKRDSDLRTHFRTANPMYYAPVICPACGYANFQRDFNQISKKEAERIRAVITPKWNARSFGGPRSLGDAVIVHKLLLLSLSAMGTSQLNLGKICLRLYWFYTDLEEETEREKYLHLSIKYLESAYQDEYLDEEGGEEIQTLYLLGELYRVDGDPQRAVTYFAKLMEHPSLHRHIKLMAREQWQVAADTYRRQKDVDCEH